MFSPYYSSKASRLRFAAPHTLAGVGGEALALLGLLMFIFGRIVSMVPNNYFISAAALGGIRYNLTMLGASLLTVSGLVLLAAYIIYKRTPDAERIRHMVYRGLCCPAYGNPLHLKDGEFLPKVSCVPSNAGRYDITITGASVAMEDIIKSAPRISALINGKYQRYAVTYTEGTPDYRKTVFHVDDVAQDRSITYQAVEDMCNYDPTKLVVQGGTAIDLTASGSMLIAGKTRSSKTTAIISLLLQVLQHKRDEFGSEVAIIDPKQAELSRLPHVTTLDGDGGARAILQAVQHFAEIITERQQTLNDQSEQCGDTVKWWQAGMRPSFLFIDEYVACRSLFPKKPDKEAPDYCLATFDDTIKRIVTMGASAGCYMIVSIAQASAGEGGLPTLIKSAMTTRVLFKPSPEEGAFIWDRASLEAVSRLPAGKQGDAWFSSSDGEHETVSRVHFPHMRFAVYRELGRLLTEYYSD